MRGAEQGLTLVELVVALVFASVAFAALALSQITGFRVTRSSQVTAIAKDVAMMHLEEIRSYGFEVYRHCPESGPGPGSGVPPCAGSAAGAEHSGFDVRWQITNKPAGIKVLDPPALLGANVFVEWQGGSYELVAYLSCGDPGETATTEAPCPADSLLTP